MKFISPSVLVASVFFILIGLSHGDGINEVIKKNKCIFLFYFLKLDVKRYKFILSLCCGH